MSGPMLAQGTHVRTADEADGRGLDRASVPAMLPSGLGHAEAVLRILRRELVGCAVVQDDIGTGGVRAA